MAGVGFRDISEQLRTAIQDGQIAGGQSLPSETQLCAKYQVSRTTVRRALGLLEADGLVEAVHGRGRVVRSSSSLRRERGETQAQYVARSLRSSYEQEAVALASLISAPEVAKQFDVAEATAREALGILAAEGLVTTVSGRGWGWRGSEVLVSKTDQVAEKIRSSIEAGVWAAGDRIPGELTLANEYQVGRITVRRAIGQLVAEGVLETRSGVGTSVTQTA